jgi:hypothetical protein
VSPRWEAAGWHSEADGHADDRTFVVRVPRGGADAIEGVVWHVDNGRWRPFRGLDALLAAITASLADGEEEP